MKKANNILIEIIIGKKKTVADAKKHLYKYLIRNIERRSKIPVGFYNAIKLSNQKYKIIGEIKHTSPSRGNVRKNFSALEINKVFQAAPEIIAISVITEVELFKGGNQLLTRVNKHNIANKPI